MAGPVARKKEAYSAPKLQRLDVEDIRRKAAAGDAYANRLLQTIRHLDQLAQRKREV